MKELKEIGSEIATGMAEIGARTIEKQIENYVQERDSLTAFKKSLAKLAAVVREEQGFPLTIIVDELDRCRPDFALALLERVKHLFDVQGVAFVLLVNRDQIESYIKSVYGDVDARAYLLKFANLFVDLPHQGMEHLRQYEKGRSDYCRALFAHHGPFNTGEPIFLQNCLEALAEHFSVTLREIERLFGGLALYYGSRSRNEFTNEFLVAMLSVLRVNNPQLYAQLREGRISLQDFLASSRLDQLKVRNFSSQIPMKMLWFCLMSDDEFDKALTAEKQAQNVEVSLSELRNWIRGDRTKIIPSLCSRLELFAFKPT